MECNKREKKCSETKEEEMKSKNKKKAAKLKKRRAVWRKCCNVSEAAVNVGLCHCVSVSKSNPDVGLKLRLQPKRRRE